MSNLIVKEHTAVVDRFLGDIMSVLGMQDTKVKAYAVTHDMFANEESITLELDEKRKIIIRYIELNV